MISSNLLHSLKLTGLTIPGNIFLAPLAGYTDAAFRHVCRKEGAFLGFTEMVSSEGASRKSGKTFNLLTRGPEEPLLGVQIFASNPRSAGESVKEIISCAPSIIDLNCGCSIPKILKSGCGAALHQNPEKVKEIIKAIKDNAPCPVSIKMRLGWDNDSINYPRMAEAALEGGIEMLTLHPRTRSQLFSGQADWSHLQKLKKLFPSLTILGSGDLFTPEDAREMLKTTGIDGLMFARGAIGNPFIFRRTIELLKTGKAAPLPETEEIISTAMEQLKLSIRIKGEKTACVEMRKQLCSYTRGLTNSSRLRSELVHCSSFKEYEDLLRIFSG